MSLSVLKDISNAGHNEQHRKFAHMKMLLQSLLPERGDQGSVIYTDRGLDPKLSPPVEDLLEDDEEEISLGELRRVAIETGRHNFTWHESVSKCAVKFEPGDIGFISGEGTRFESFLKVGNIFELSESKEKAALKKYDISVVKETLGTQYQWLNGFRDNREAWPFVLPDDLEG